jgi:hypothetical protein
MDLLKTIYGYGETLSASTKKDEIKQKNLDLIDAIKGTIGLQSLDTKELMNETPEQAIQKTQNLPME